MRLCLDSHVLVWLAMEPAAVSGRVRSSVADRATEVWISAASAWELEAKRIAGRLPIPEDLFDQARVFGARSLAITFEHALRAARLPRHHADPIDRILVAQAQAENLTLVTADRQLGSYDVEILPAGA